MNKAPKLVLPDLKTPSEFTMKMALEFYRAGSVLSEKAMEVDTNLLEKVPPVVINFSFAIELGLKCLLQAEKAKIKKTHNLLSLFSCLREETQLEINKVYKKNYQSALKNDQGRLKKFILQIKNQKDIKQHLFYPELNDVTQLLKIHSESFTDWRYLFQFNGKTRVYIYDFIAMNSLFTTLIGVFYIEHQTKVVLESFAKQRLALGITSTEE